MRRPAPHSRRADERGFSLLEVMIVVVLIAVLTVAVWNFVGDKIHKARLSACMAELHSIQESVFMESLGLNYIAAPQDVWNNQWNGSPPGPYHYLTDNDDPNAGHGNELDGYDEGNPGDSPRPQKDIQFVILCQHDHANLARYVYVEDERPPALATDGNDPNYERFLKFGGGGGEPGGGSGSPGGGGPGGPKGGGGGPKK